MSLDNGVIRLVSISSRFEIVSDEFVPQFAGFEKSIERLLELDQQRPVRLQNFLGGVVRFDEILCEKG